MEVSEAKEKVCPFMTDNQGIHEKVPTKCICGDCMAWEATVEKIVEPKGVFTHPKGSRTDGYNNKGRLVWYKISEDDGYCQRLTNDNT